MVSTVLSRTQRAANFPPTLAWSASAILGSLSFSRSNRIPGLFMKRLVFSFNLMVVSTRSWSLPLLAPGKDIVFALLMLDLKHWGVRMKSIWLWTCPLGACQVAVLDSDLTHGWVPVLFCRHAEPWNWTELNCTVLSSMPKHPSMGETERAVSTHSKDIFAQKSSKGSLPLEILWEKWLTHTFPLQGALELVKQGKHDYFQSNAFAYCIEFSLF